MSGFFGMPGIGGSLGCCAVCGNGFITEILLGTSVKQFDVAGIAQTLSAHEKCMDTLKGCGPDWEKLPAGPLRKVFEEAHTASPSPERDAETQ